MNNDVTSSIPPPEVLETRFNAACVLHENSQLEDAVIAYRDLLAILPDFSLLHFNCGLALFELERYPEAGKHYKTASRLCPDDPDIHYNRGLNQRRLKQYAKAAHSFEHAIQLGDTNIDTLYSLGLCYQDLHDDVQAARIYDTILTQHPAHLSTLNNYAYLCHKTGQLHKAETLYRKLLSFAPDHQAAKHMINSLSGKVTDTAPIEYVEAIFDNYAENFDHSLVEHLHYNTPKALWNCFCTLRPHWAKDKARQGVDLGCGTGLAGEHFAACCKSLDGVDISQKMLDVASNKSLYQRLIKDDILHFLQNSENCYDLILAADVFTYMGDLGTLFAECSNCMADEGLFLFSVEESTNKMFELKPTGRFGHATSYINDLCQSTGWNILDCLHSKLRQDKNQWIWGYLYIVERDTDT